MLANNSIYMSKTKRCNNKSASQKKAMPCRKVLSGKEAELLKQIDPGA